MLVLAVANIEPFLSSAIKNQKKMLLSLKINTDLMNLIIDEGNTRIKLAVYNKSQLIDIEFSTFDLFSEDVLKLQEKYKFEALIISSVTHQILNKKELVSIPHRYILSNLTPVPFVNKYKTPKTLGVDRIALTMAAYCKYPNQHSLVIDAGTCITYDFIKNDGIYIGGAIAPGIKMRYESMHTFTQKLPLLTKPEEDVRLTGATTNESMHSGVINGTMFEIEGVINSYQQKYESINVILTGGDANFLDKQLKNSIFVNPNFLLEGLNEVLMYQQQHEI